MAQPGLAKESDYRDSQDADGLILIPTNRLGRTVISSRLINETICQAADSKNINLSRAAGAGRWRRREAIKRLLETKAVRRSRRGGEMGGADGGRVETELAI